MNQDKYIEKALKSLIKMYTKIENDLLIKIASHFSINEEFLNSDYFRIEKLDEMGLFNKEVSDYLEKYANKTREDLQKALNDIGYNAYNLDELSQAFENDKLKINPKKLIENNTIQGIINNSYNEINNRFVEISNKIETSVREAYLDVIENVYLRTTMGESYQTAIRSAIDELSNKGIKILTYQVTDKTGFVTGLRNYDIEGTVRRDTLLSCRKLTNNINLKVIDELECEYIYISEHDKCRPDHFDWQGTIVKREDFIKVTHYGEVTGLGGPNCAHFFTPYFGDKRGKELKNISKKEAEKQYNLSQHQRYLEKGVRKWKRKREMFRATDDVKYFKKCNLKVKEWQNKLMKFTDKYKLNRDFDREYVSKTSINLLNDENLIPKFMRDSFNKISEKDKAINLFPDKFRSELDKVKVKVINSKGPNYYDIDTKIITIKETADKYSYIHEYTHYLEEKYQLYKSKELKTILKEKFNKYTKDDFKPVIDKKTSKVKYWVLKDSSDFVSSYQSRVYKYIDSFGFVTKKVKIEYCREYLSEGMKYYFKDVNLLKSKDIKLYNYIKNFLGEKDE